MNPVPESPYRRAPITEAVIDVCIRQENMVGFEVLADLVASEKLAYPTVHQMEKFTAHTTLSVQSQQAPQVQESKVSGHPLGFVAKSQDGKFVWQARQDGFTLSRLAPYENWQTFRAEAVRLWTRYRDSIPQAIPVRLALRYINRLDIPEPVSEFDLYLRTFPTVSSDMNQGIADYLLQLLVPYPEHHCLVRLTQASVVAVIPNTAAIVLDIDAVRDHMVPTADVEIWETIEQLRAIKNEVFQACITNRTRRLFA